MKVKNILFLAFSALLLFTSCSKKVYFSEGRVEQERINERLDYLEDESTDSIIRPYRTELEDEMNRVIGYLENSIQKYGGNSTMGQFVSDLSHEQIQAKFDVKPDFTIMNPGGLRINELSKGDITVSDIYQLMPFDNTLTVVQVSGRTVKTLADHMARSGGWPVSNGFYMKISDKKAYDIRINDERVKPTETYQLLTNSYVAGGGSGCSFLKDLPQEEYPYLLRDAIIEYIEKKTADGETIKVKSETRNEISNR